MAQVKLITMKASRMGKKLAISGGGIVDVTKEGEITVEESVAERLVVHGAGWQYADGRKNVVKAEADVDMARATTRVRQAKSGAVKVESKPNIRSIDILAGLQSKTVKELRKMAEKIGIDVPTYGINKGGVIDMIMSKM